MKSGFNYMYIVNPETGRKVQTNGILGKKILNKYVTYLSGGAGPKAVAAARRSAARRSAARRSSPQLDERRKNHLLTRRTAFIIRSN